MSDEGEDFASIQTILDMRAERNRMIQSSNKFRAKVQKLEKLSGYYRNPTKDPTQKYETILGCRITKEMNEMCISDKEFELLWEFINAIFSVTEAQKNWTEAFSYRLKPLKGSKNRPKYLGSEKECKILLHKANVELEKSGVRLFLLELVVKLHTNKSGSSLTWFTLLLPQLKIRYPDFHELFLENIQGIFEKGEALVDREGLEHCVKEYLISYLS